MRVSGFRSVNAALPFILALITCTPAVLAAAGAFEISLEDSTGFGPPPAYDLRDLDRKTRTDLPGADMLFSFAIIADSHIRPYGYDSTYYIKANSISRELLANFVRDINDHLPRVDFVVHLGDVTDNGSVDEFEWAGSILDSLECPLYPVVGNHDNFQSDDKQAFKDCFGLDSTHYSFDYFDMHFIVIDCTLQPYVPPRVHCHAVERAWVEQDLAANPDKPTIVLSHYNMWERGWCATFDTTCHYQEYEGVAYLRQILEEAGNVVAVLNGHVHANRVEVHNGIYYLDINATLVGRPSVRYFYVYQERIDVDYEYISDDSLFNHVQALCGRCTACFDPDLVCDFVDGAESDKKFTMFYGNLAAEIGPGGAPEFQFRVIRDHSDRLLAEISGARLGMLRLSIYDVTGRRIDTCCLYKPEESFVVDLRRELAGLNGLSGGIYFVTADLGGRARTLKLPIVR